MFMTEPLDFRQTDSTLRRQPRASAADVAREAGVSVSAVSRAFTPGASVSARMRTRVMAAAEKLDYLPNVLARSLMTQRTHLVGVILANFNNPLYLTVLDHFTENLQRRGLRTILLNVSHHADLDSMARLVLQYGVDGLVVSAGAISPVVTEQCINRQIPLVAFARRPRRSKLHVVCADNVAGGRMAARQFLDSGHQSFAVIGGPRVASTSEERLKGFEAELREAGHEPFAREHAELYDYDAGKAAARRLLSAGRCPDAIFCASDMIALGALDHLRFDLGLKVPQDVSVIGFDDVAISAANAFDLSTIRQPIAEMVEQTTDILCRQIDHWSDDWETRLFSCSYIDRGTVAAR